MNSRLMERYHPFAGARTHRLTHTLYELMPSNAYQATCTVCRRDFWTTKYLNLCLGPANGPHVRWRPASIAPGTRVRFLDEDTTERTGVTTWLQGVVTRCHDSTNGECAGLDVHEPIERCYWVRVARGDVRAVWIPEDEDEALFIVADAT